MQIGDLAAATDTSVQSIRYYEREGLLPAPARTQANYRAYDTVHVQRLQFIRRCRALGFKVTNSKTNFLFAGAHPAVSGGEYYAALRQNNILVRHFTLPRIENWVRITVGTAAQMQRLVAVTKGILAARQSTADA